MHMYTYRCLNGSRKPDARPTRTRKMCACIAADEDQLNALFANPRSRACFFCVVSLVWSVRVHCASPVHSVTSWKWRKNRTARTARTFFLWLCCAHEVRVVLCLSVYLFACVRGCDTDFAGKETDSKLLCSVYAPVCVSWCVFMCVKHAHLLKWLYWWD